MVHIQEQLCWLIPSTFCLRVRSVLYYWMLRLSQHLLHKALPNETNTWKRSKARSKSSTVIIDGTVLGAAQSLLQDCSIFFTSFAFTSITSVRALTQPTGQKYHILISYLCASIYTPGLIIALRQPSTKNFWRYLFRLSSESVLLELKGRRGSRWWSPGLNMSCALTLQTWITMNQVDEEPSGR